MTADQTAIVLEKELKRIVNLAICMQGFSIATLAYLYFLVPGFHPKHAQIISLIALFSSFGISKIYISKGKELENFKTFSDEEFEVKRKEYFTVFFSPYPFWTFMCTYFSYSYLFMFWFFLLIFYKLRRVKK